MRALATIIAAVLSVTTGGPLRCPCQLVPQVRVACAESVSVPRPDESSCSGCRCRGHHEEETPSRSPADAPTQDRHESPQAPCPHGPGIDLAAPPGGVEPGDAQSGADQPAAIGGHTFDLALSAACCAAALRPPAPSSSTCQHLRFCHAFRC